MNISEENNMNIDIDKEIIYAEEKAEDFEMKAGFDTDYACYSLSESERQNYRLCASKYRQLAEKLTELKHKKQEIEELYQELNRLKGIID
jgi:hypothetical protein